MDGLDDPSGPADMGMADDAVDVTVELVLDPRGPQILEPGVEPDLVGRPVENTVGARAGGDQVENQGQPDIAFDVSIGEMGVRGHQRAGEPFGEELLIPLRLVVGVDELPPAHRLVDLLPSGVTAGVHLPEPVHEEIDLALLQTHLGRQVGEQILEDLLEVPFVSRKACRHLDRRLAIERELNPGGVDQVVDHVAVPERDPAHGVGDVLVEAGEEPEAVLSR